MCEHQLNNTQTQASVHCKGTAEGVWTKQLMGFGTQYEGFVNTTIASSVLANPHILICVQ
jgi:hypothetical protein